MLARAEAGEGTAQRAPDAAAPRLTEGMPDLDALLAPISAEQPAGESLRYGEVYDQIKEARREDDPTLPQGVWQTKLKQADWPAMADACVQALSTRSKDLQVGAWLLEAWFHLYGLAGVERGLTLLRQLCEAFWEDLYPELSQGVEARLAPITWLNEKFPTAIWAVAVTQPEHDPAAVSTFADWEKARGAADTAQRTRLHESAVLTPRAFYVQSLSTLQDSLDAAAALEACLGERCGDEAPTLHQLRAQLEAVRQLVAALLAEHYGTVDGGEETAALDTAPAGAANGVAAAPSSPIRSRAEAYQRLAEVADYLSHTEPHSPTPYLIRRAIAWGRMPLGDLLEELVRDPSDLRAVYSLLGIAPESRP